MAPQLVVLQVELGLGVTDVTYGLSLRAIPYKSSSFLTLTQFFYLHVVKVPSSRN